MSKESAKKLIAELQTNEDLKAKVAGITDPAELLKIANESGYDVTMEELTEAEREYKRDKAAETDEKLSFDDLEGVAGGGLWTGDDAPDGHEMGCAISYHGTDWQIENNIWCTKYWYCQKSLYSTDCKGNSWEV
jgi:predicted ribosomally synthesized peptide with nif11-like leader